jgi:hypothetical protein
MATVSALAAPAPTKAVRASAPTVENLIGVIVSSLAAGIWIPRDRATGRIRHLPSGPLKTAQQSVKSGQKGLFLPQMAAFCPELRLT